LLISKSCIDSNQILTNFRDILFLLENMSQFSNLVLALILIPICSEDIIVFSRFFISSSKVPREHSPNYYSNYSEAPQELPENSSRSSSPDLQCLKKSLRSPWGLLEDFLRTRGWVQHPPKILKRQVVTLLKMMRLLDFRILWWLIYWKVFEHTGNRTPDPTATHTTCFANGCYHYTICPY
jgi:hypothetical protein